MRWSLVLGFTALVVAYSPLQSNKIEQIKKKYPPESYFDIKDPDGYLEPILKVRLPGTDNSTQVQKHFSEFFKTLDPSWNVDLDSFNADTPIEKSMSFTNVIATRDPPGAAKGDVGRIVLAAHYDSKLEPEGFIGAIDSAFPCAAIMYALNVIDSALTQKWQHEESSRRVGLQVIFFDGEEALKEWTSTDSIYGARHLANRMEKAAHPTNSVRKSDLDAIDVLVLLDLLGTSNPDIPSYFRNTDWLHVKLGDIQTRLHKAKLTKEADDTSYFPRPPEFRLGGIIGDDHLPFLQRGVPILHLIPSPFPSVWHKITDDAEHLSPESMHDWGLIMSTLVAEYFELDNYLFASEGAVLSASHHDAL